MQGCSSSNLERIAVSLSWKNVVKKNNNETCFVYYCQQSFFFLYFEISFSGSFFKVHFVFLLFSLNWNLRRNQGVWWNIVNNTRNKTKNFAQSNWIQYFCKREHFQCTARQKRSFYHPYAFFFAASNNVRVALYICQINICSRLNLELVMCCYLSCYVHRWWKHLIIMTGMTNYQ